MSQPGWYPDPQGSPGHFRYWDGTTWSPQTTTSPGAPPAAPGAPPQGNRSGMVVAVVALVVLLIVGVVIWRATSSGGAAGPFGGGQDTNTSTPTVSAWDETSTASPTPSDDPTNTGGTMVDCPTDVSDRGIGIVDGRLVSGNISAPALGGKWDTGRIMIQGLSDPVSQTKTITYSWFSLNAVGAASKALGFTSVRFTAQALTDCFATSGYYPGFTGRKTIISDPVTIDGAQAYRIRTEVYVDGQGANIPGDVMDVIAIDTGNADTFGVYVASATIGDAETQAEVDSAIRDLRVNR